MNTNTEEEINKLWLKNIYQAIKMIADFEGQKLIWFGKSLEFETSFAEYLMVLYDDLHFEMFISIENWKALNLSEELFIEVNKLNILLDAYDIQKPDAEVILDPNWHKITMQAKIVIEVWDATGL